MVGFANSQPDRGSTDDRCDDEPEEPDGEDPDADLLREMIGFAAERLMELEVGALIGAGYGEKSPERLAQRNGYRERDSTLPRRR
jgi:transposase-like protein